MVVDYIVEGDSFVTVVVAGADPSSHGGKKHGCDTRRQALRVFPRPEVKEATGSVQVTFLVNFFDELQRRAPAGGNLFSQSVSRHVGSSRVFVPNRGKQKAGSNR